MKYIVYIIMCTISLHVFAESQPSDTLLARCGKDKRVWASKVDAFINRFSGAVSRADTFYIRRGSEKLRVKLLINYSSSSVGITNNQGEEYTLESQNKRTIGVQASYTGLSVGLAFNPEKLFNRYKDYKLNINSYGNAIGGDLVYHVADSYRFSTSESSEIGELGQAAIKQSLLMLSGYYAFNSKRFSFPAAFTGSWIQLQSSGSAMMGLSLLRNRLDIEQNESTKDRQSQIRTSGLSMGVGYGYNWVFGRERKWLLHLSSLPQWIIYNKYTLQGETKSTWFSTRPFNVVVIGRMSLVRHFDKTNIYCSAVVNNSQFDFSRNSGISRIKWRARAFWGFKL